MDKLETNKQTGWSFKFEQRFAAKKNKDIRKFSTVSHIMMIKSRRQTK